MEKGFTPDGYISDQNCFEDYIYRGISSSINGCGWIAVYDFLWGLEKPVDHRQVHREMNAFFPRQIPGPTPVRVLRRYLRRWGKFPFHWGRRRMLAAAVQSRAGILRYWEGNEPHFVPYVREREGNFRFFNVCDGQEEIVLSMEAFFAFHCTRRLVRGLTDQ